MEEREIAIPFDIEMLHENLLQRIARNSIAIVKVIIKRIVEIVISLIGIIILIPLAVVVFFKI